MDRRKPLRFTRRNIPVDADSPLNSLRIADPLGASQPRLFGLAEPEFASAADDSPVFLGFDFPDFPEEMPVVERLEQLLMAASAIEHALLVQYLYTGYSARLGNGSNVLLEVAIEEMSHLMTVQNLLMSIGAPPYLERENVQELFPFPLQFEGLSKTSLAKFVIAESPENPDLTPDEKVLFDKIRSEAELGAGQEVSMVGTLYALLGVFFGTESTLQERADQGDPWASIVDVFASVAADHYGGRDKIHLAEDFAFIDDPKQGDKDTEWDRSVEKEVDEFRIFRISDRDTALDALRDIAIQGEGPGAPAGGDDEVPHFRRFFEQYRDFFGGTGTAPDVYPVPLGSKITVGSMASGADGISDPATIPWADLATIRYWILLGSLEQALISPKEDRQSLVAWTFTEMYHLKQLAKVLVERPAQPGIPAADRAAGIPFNLPAQLPLGRPADPAGVVGAMAAWSPLLSEWLTQAIGLVEQILPSTADADQKRLLEYMLRVDRRKLLEADARQRGESQASDLDLVREMLDWAAGTGDPLSHGAINRFWNLPLDPETAGGESLRTVAIFGQQIIGDSSDNSAMYQALLEDFGFGGQMPAKRAKLTDEEVDPGRTRLAHIRQWLDKGAPEHDQAQNGTAVREISDLRILPPLTIGRFGSSGITADSPYPDPMDNYTVEPATTPGETRTLKPAETLFVDPATGRITKAEVPAGDRPRFRGDDQRIRPVAPFLEVWARFDDNDEFVPFTTKHLQDLGLSAESVAWTVEAANRKAYRRTGQVADIVQLQPLTFSDHSLHDLQGRGDNLISGRTIPFGWVQYIRPTAPEGRFPELRLRFTPSAGRVYGHQQDFPELVVAYDSALGAWDGHQESFDPGKPPVARIFTAPANIFARDASDRSLGYLDDSCDGIITVEINGKQAKARFSSGPPDFAPDSQHLRTVGDDIDQLIKGPVVEPNPLADGDLADAVIHLLQRVTETMRLMDTARLNGRFAGNAFAETEAAYSNVLRKHRQFAANLSGLKAPSGSPERQDAIQTLTILRAFLRDWNQTGDSSQAGNRRMPAMMRGNDGGRLALTRRQLSLIDRAITVFSTSQVGQTPEDQMLTMISNLGAVFASLHSNFSLDGRSLEARFANPPDVLEYLENAVADGGFAESLGLTGQKLMVPGDAASSPFMQLISNPNHPMNGPLGAYEDPISSNNGIKIVRLWIDSLA